MLPKAVQGRGCARAVLLWEEEVCCSETKALLASLGCLQQRKQCCAVGERAAGAPAALLSSHHSLLALPLAVLPAGPRIYISLLGAKRGAAAQAAWLRKINKLFNKAFYPLYILSLIKILHRQKVQKLV